MANVQHSSLTQDELHEPFHRVAASDPGAIGADTYWLDTSSEPYVLKRRNATDDGWIVVGAEGASYTDEQAQDAAASLIQNGTGITWSYNDGANTLTPTVTITQYTDEAAQDAVGGILDDGGDIDFTYDDAIPKITAVVKSTAVTYAKLQNVSAAEKLLGRGAGAGAGDAQEITLGTNLTMSGTTLNAGGTAVDSDAIHDNVSGEISALTEKVTPVGDDLILIEDSAASNAKKKVKLSNVGGGGGASLLLDFDFSTDQANAVSIGDGSTWTDIIANHSFTVTDANSIIEIVYSGNIVITGTWTYRSRINIDDDGVVKPLAGGSGPAGLPTGGVVFVDGLSAGAHTVKLQMNANGSGDAAYCRCSTLPQEQLSLRVMQFLK